MASADLNDAQRRRHDHIILWNMLYRQSIIDRSKNESQKKIENFRRLQRYKNNDVIHIDVKKIKLIRALFGIEIKICFYEKVLSKNYMLKKCHLTQTYIESFCIKTTHRPLFLDEKFMRASPFSTTRKNNFTNKCCSHSAWIRIQKESLQDNRKNM